MHADVRYIDDVIPFFEVPTTMARISWILFQIEMTNVSTIVRAYISADVHSTNQNAGGIN